MPLCKLMSATLQATATFLLACLISCSDQPGDKKNSLSKEDSVSGNAKTPVLNSPKSLVKNYGANDCNRLFAFVGEKISVEPLPYKQGSRDKGFKAKYAIVKKVYGNFSEDTIEFVAFDHYGTPNFSKFKNILLYVSADSGTYFHQSYLYNDVYKSKDGRWAGPYTSYDYEHPYNKHTKIKPVKIQFADKVVYLTKALDDEGREIRFSYPEPYFKTVGKYAFAIYGNYVEDLFDLTKSGVLTSRGLFEPTAQQEEDMVESNQPEPPKTPPSADDLKFLTFWRRFVLSLKEPGLIKFRKIALDTLYVCDQLLPAGKFIVKCFDEMIDDEVRKRIVDRTKLEYTSNEVAFNNLLTSQVKKEIIKVSGSYGLRQMLVTRSTKNDNPSTIYFGFIETKKGYRLYEIGHHWHKECCQ